MLNQQEKKYVLGELIKISNKLIELQQEIDNLGYYIADDNPAEWVGAIPTGDVNEIN